MYLPKTILTILILCSLSFAYQDADIDGVDDSIDKCPNTPFDALVDERGCSDSDNYNGVLTFKIGSEISFDTFSDTTTNFNLFANYRYNSWDVSLSNSTYSNYDRFGGVSSSNGDLYLSGGYLFISDEFNTKVSLGTKFATADDGVGSGEDDYFASLNFNYFINQKQDIFLYYGYTLSGDSKEFDYEDFYSYAIGSGYMLNSKWYSSISYDYSGSNYDDTEAYRSLSWFNSYQFSKRFFTTLNYSYGLDDISYEHSISLKLGVRFE